MSAAAKIDLRFGDASALSMNPCLPYGWQAKGETVAITLKSSRRTNVFGIFSSDNHSLTKFSEQNINSQFVVAVIDEFCRQMPAARPTVLVPGNASLHHSPMCCTRLCLFLFLHRDNNEPGLALMSDLLPLRC